MGVSLLRFSLARLLTVLVFASLYDQVDTKFTFYNPNRTYTDVTRTWSMFVGNTTLLRTVTDTLSTVPPTSKRVSIIDETVHYEEIVDPVLSRSSSSSSSFSAGLNSDEISSSTSMFELDLLIEQVRTTLDELRFSHRVFERLEDLLTDLDRRIKEEIHEQTAKTLEIETILNDFNFLHSIDEEETSKTIDSGFEGEQRTLNSIFTDLLQRILFLLQVNRCFSLSLSRNSNSLFSTFNIARTATINSSWPVLTINALN